MAVSTCLQVAALPARAALAPCRAPQARALRLAAPGLQRCAPSGHPAAAVPAARPSGPSGGKFATVAKAAAARSGGTGLVVETGATDAPGRAFASSLALMVLMAALISERVHGAGLVEALELDHPHAEPLLWAASAGLAAAAAWPDRKRSADGVSLIREMAGRLAFAGLAAAIAIELYTGSGLLSLLEVRTGAEALSEAEVGLAAVTLLLLTGPRKVR